MIKTDTMDHFLRHIPTLMFRRIFWACVCLVCALAVNAQQVQVNAPSRVDLGDSYFQVSYTVAGDDAKQFVPPATHDFELLSSPAVSQFSSMSNINGKKTQSSSVTFTLTYRPLRQGRFTLPAAAMQVRGKTVRSRTVTIEVTANSTSKSGGEASQSSTRTAGNSPRVTADDLFIRATLESTEVYEQQAVLLTYRFYALPGVGLSNIGLSEKPDFKGVVSQEVPIKDIQATTAVVKGRTYRTGIMQQYLLFPQQAGNIEIPGITFDCYVIQQTQVDDMIDAFFNGTGSVGMTLKRSTPAMKIHVKALPQPRPADFSGGVGQFSIKGALATSRPKANEACTYRLTVSGRGNLKMLMPPTLQTPADFDVFTPKTDEHTSETADGVSGDMVYEYTFVPRNVGDYTLPGITFTYFDPTTQAYRTLRTEDIVLHVGKGSKSDEEYERERALRAMDIRDIHPVGSRSPGLAEWMQAHSWLYGLVYLLLILSYILCIRLFRGYLAGRADTPGNRSRKAARLAAKRLQQAGKLLSSGADNDYYAAVARALYGFMADRYGIGTSEMNRDTIRRLLAEHATPEFQQQMLELLDECEMAQYAPVGDSARKEETYRRALELMARFK